MATNPARRGKYPLSSREQQDRDEAFEAYLLDHVPGLKDYYAAQHETFLRLRRMRTRAIQIRRRTTSLLRKQRKPLCHRGRGLEAQLRRSFAPLAVHLPNEVKRSRRRFVQRAQRAWNRANPTPLTSDLQRALRVEFMKTYAGSDRS